MAQLVKNAPAVQETWIQSLGWEDLLEKGMATHSSILAWRTPWTVWGHQEPDTTERLSHAHITDLLQRKCLESLPRTSFLIVSCKYFN